MSVQLTEVTPACRSILVKRMFRGPEDDCCPPPAKLSKEETQKRGACGPNLKTVSFRLIYIHANGSWGDCSPHAKQPCRTAALQQVARTTVPCSSSVWGQNCREETPHKTLRTFASINAVLTFLFYLLS